MSNKIVTSQDIISRNAIPRQHPGLKFVQEQQKVIAALPSAKKQVGQFAESQEEGIGPGKHPLVQMSLAMRKEELRQLDEEIQREKRESKSELTYSKNRGQISNVPNKPYYLQQSEKDAQGINSNNITSNDEITQKSINLKNQINANIQKHEEEYNLPKKPAYYSLIAQPSNDITNPARPNGIRLPLIGKETVQKGHSQYESSSILTILPNINSSSSSPPLLRSGHRGVSHPSNNPQPSKRTSSPPSQTLDSTYSQYQIQNRGQRQLERSPQPSSNQQQMLSRVSLLQRASLQQLQNQSDTTTTTTTITTTAQKLQKQKQLQQQQQHQGDIKLPHSLRDMSIIKIPNDDEVHFEEFQYNSDISTVERYSEFLSNDDDLFYLQSNFPQFYAGDVLNQLQIEDDKTIALKGVSNSFRVSLKTIANNPMVFAGLSAQIAQPNSNNNTISNITSTSQQPLISPHQQYDFPGYEDTQFQSKGTNQQIINHNTENTSNTNGNTSEVSSNYNQNRSKTNTNSTNGSFFFKNSVASKSQHSIPEMTAKVLLGEFNKINEMYPSHKVEAFKIFIVTKFKVKIDLGFIQISSNQPSTLILQRLYVSRTYRKLNYANFIYLQVLNYLFGKYPFLERISLTLSNRSQILKFAQAVGFRLDNVKAASANNNNNSNKSSQLLTLLLRKADFQPIFAHIVANKINERPLENQNINNNTNKFRY